MAKNLQFKNYEIGVSGVIKELDEIKHKLDERDDEIVSGKREVDTQLLSKYRLLKNILKMVKEFI